MPQFSTLFIKHWITLFVLLGTATIHATPILCAIQDGSASNNLPCVCGSNYCSQNTGLICYATIGPGYCRKILPGEYAYSLAYTETCDSEDGRYSVVSSKMCVAALVSTVGSSPLFDYKQISMPVGIPSNFPTELPMDSPLDSIWTVKSCMLIYFLNCGRDPRSCSCGPSASKGHGGD